MKLISCLKKYCSKWLLACLLILLSNIACAQPVAKFSGTTLTGCAPILVHFTDESTGNPDYWKWDLGNGTISYLQNPSVTYLIPGNYSVKLVVKNILGADSVVKTGYVQVYAAPVPDFSASQTNGCNSLTVNYTNQSSPAISLQWDFGDGVFSDQESPSHFYSQTGSYNVSLKAVNDFGCQATIVKQAYINVNEAKANFSHVATDRCNPTRVNFQNTSTWSGRSSFKWYFGNGDSSSEQNPVYTYPTGGTYVVKLITTTISGCEDIFTDTVIVKNKVSAAFTASATNVCKIPATIQFATAQLQGNNYYWTINDSVSFTGAEPLYVFNDTGLYSVRLVVVNNNGCTDSLSKTNYISIQKPFVSFTNLPDSSCAPWSKNIQVNTSGSDLVQSYLWKFSDGTTSTSANPTHIFTTEGYHGITLIATGISGCKDTTVMNHAVKISSRPDADFTSTTRDACGQTQVGFIGTAVGEVTQWIWNFGDNAQGFEQNTMHRFTDTGFLDVQLIAYNGGCADTVTKQNYMHIKPSVAKMKISFGCDNPNVFSFTNLSLGAERWLWNFGDSTTSTELNPVHVYSDTGHYNVSLTTYNSLTGCEGYKSGIVNVADIKPDFFASDSFVCKNTDITFRATVDSGEANRFLWFFSDGTTETTMQNFVIHSFDRPGIYDVTLVTMNEVNCRDTVVKTGYIKVNNVKAKFGIATNMACANVPVTFNDSSSAEYGNNIQSWRWNYGDGIIETVTAPPFIHSYRNGGNYMVKLTVTDNNGCTDSYEKQSLLTIKKPVAQFRPFDTVKCSGNEIKFVCPFAETGTSYYWDFGDGSNATVQQPRHIYTAEGMYTVKLKVALQSGCADSSVQENLIRIVDPVAKFTMSDSFRNCPPLIIQFNNQSVNGIDEVWDFGDGSSTNERNPSHFYSVAGTYTVSLTVKGAGGCTSRMQRQVVVKGPKGSLTYTPLQFCNPPADVTFTAHTQDAVSYIWDFNDGVTNSNTDTVVTHRYNNAGNYMPRLLITDNNGCRVPVTGIDTVKLINLKAQFEFPNSITCSRDNIDFINTTTSGDNITSCHWNFGDGFFANNMAGAAHAYETPGTYYPSLAVTTANGCRDTFVTTTPVVVAPPPAFEIISSGNGCTPLTASFNAALTNTTVPVMQWQWEFGNGNTSASQTPATQTYTTASTYIVSLTATSNEGCRKTITKNISAYPSPVLTITGNTEICSGGNTTLTASGASSYAWTASNSLSCTNCSSTVATPQSTSVFTITGKDISGCTSSKSITVQVKEPIHLSYNANVQLCKGSSTTLPVSGGEVYEWSPSTGLSSNNEASPTAQPQTTTTYKVIAKDSRNCSADTGFITVQVNALPQIDAGTDKSLNRGSAIELIPTVSQDVTEVIWTPTGSIFRNAGNGISVKPLSTTEYTATAKNAAGCIAKDKITVVVTDAVAESDIFIPNTFSPNGDGANDIFYPRSTGSIKINRMKIMNRNGTAVFEKYNFFTNDVSSAWDGTYKGTTMQSDVYIYAIEITGADGKAKVISGNVSLMR